MKEHRVLIKTDSYTGNFEREMCAHMTGAIGECGVGWEFVDTNIQVKFEEIIKNVTDASGCARPVEVSDQDSSNFWIFFHENPSSDLLELMDQRAKTFCQKSLEIDLYPAKFNYLGLELYEEALILIKKL